MKKRDETTVLQGDRACTSLIELLAVHFLFPSTTANLEVPFFMRSLTKRQNVAIEQNDEHLRHSSPISPSPVHVHRDRPL
ncbi:hypothetical protein L596_001865 [Steinernema carpocapsae]|uniref:Uncharacterized protein n=1 Tax=Steinernema carpocapsae TaxID=34508 RepID=A0A4U8UMR3_STECR|nr:hypothetical protein L596_001865 [Steinernema carpocapsae]